MFLLACAAALGLSGVASAGVVDPTKSKNFGHSIKNGHFLPGPTEITTFEHNCTSAPCVITQLHCPTAGPKGWDLAVVKFYIDHETTPSVSFTLLELANLGRMGHGSGAGAGDGGPWGIGLLGHTAANGGVYSTIRIPFGSHVKATITNGTPKSGTFWFIVRGVENYPIVVGDVSSPPPHG